MYLVNNENYKEDKNGTQVKFAIEPKVENDGQKMKITLIVDIFKDALKNNYPFEMNLEMTGFFETENGESDKFIKNAIAIYIHMWEHLFLHILQMQISIH